MRKLEQAVLVEGKYDAARLTNLVDATILTTDGSRVFRDKELQNMLKRIAAAQGLQFTVSTGTLRGVYPNTAMLRLVGVSGRKLEVMGESIGGGRINICRIDGITTHFGGDRNTLIVFNHDSPGHVAAVTGALSRLGINIATMQLFRSEAGGYAVMVLECDQPLPEQLPGELSALNGIIKVTILNV